MGQAREFQRIRRLTQSSSRLKLQRAMRFDVLALLGANQSIEVAGHATLQLLRECPLHLAATERAGQRPANPSAVTPAVQAVSSSVSGSRAEAQLGNALASPLPSAF